MHVTALEVRDSNVMLKGIQMMDPAPSLQRKYLKLNTNPGESLPVIKNMKLYACFVYTGYAATSSR